MKALYNKYEKHTQKEFNNIYSMLAKLLSGKNATPKQIKELKEKVKKLEEASP